MRPIVHFALWRLGLALPGTQTSDAERRCLACHAAGRRRIVEVGVWHGVTTRLLRTVMGPDGVLWAVDPFPPGRLGVNLQRPIARRQVENVENGAVHWSRMSGVAAAAEYTATMDEPVDFVFIDGDHTFIGIQSDWTAWSALVSVGGVVALHDSRPCTMRRIEDAGSVRFTRDVALRDPRFDAVEAVDTLTVLRRREGV